MSDHEATPSDGRIRWWELLPLLGTGAILTTCMLSYKGYIKDDAFISLRFARNLAEGNGMVFNLGEQVEGYTNFLWIVLSAPAFWVGADPVTWIKVLGAMCSLGAMVQVFLMARWLNGDRPSAFHYIPPLLLASSTSVALWAMSGMAPSLLLLLGTSATFHLWRAHRDGRRFDFVMAGLAMALAALTRPEGHVFFIAGVMVLGIQAIRRRRIAPEVWYLVAVFSIIVAPYHIWRYAYFGYLLPNTYYAKATAGSEVWGAGVAQLGGFMAFNVNGALAGAALLALIPSRKRLYRGIGLLLCVFFMLYLIKIGRDEMKHYRLFLPVYGLFVVLAGEGLRGLCEIWKGWKPRWLSAVPAFALALVPVMLSLQFTKEHRYEDGYLKMSRNSFQRMGEYIRTNSDPSSDTAIFQDMGACPYSAYPVRFTDPIGVLNPFVAHELAAIGCNPFLRGIKASQPGGREQINELDRKVREHLFEQDARWVGMIAYVSKGGDRRSKFRKRFDALLDRGDVEALEKHLGSRLRGNSHHHGLYNDPRFAQRYEFETCWRRNNGYYLVLYERRK
jgi:arabinofuranosyltransferase